MNINIFAIQKIKKNVNPFVIQKNQLQREKRSSLFNISIFYEIYN